MTSRSPVISVRNLSKTYLVPEREPGLAAALKSLVRRRSREVHAVSEIGFEVRPGEIVGFLGPNGAGKTTTLKMLSGLLYPSAGTVRVLDHTPSLREKAFLRQITLVMGQRNRAIYRLPSDRFRETLRELVELLEIGDLLTKPVRNLSLGERMKCEIAVALLHRPAVLFLDEPTIGLDVTMQRRIRSFVGDYNRRYGATVLLTSHYMADVEALCRRVIVIHRGRILFDGLLDDLVKRFSPHKTVVVELESEAADLRAYGEVIGVEGCRVTLRVPKAETAAATSMRPVRVFVCTECLCVM